MDTAFGWPNGTVRGVIAIALILAFCFMAVKVIWFSPEPTDALQMLKELALVIIGFYFAKSVETPQRPPEHEHEPQPPNPPVTA